MSRNNIANSLLRVLIREMINEVDVSELEDVCYTSGSTHVMQTCKIGKDKYFLKFSDEDLFDAGDPSLQILIEYLAYRIYSLYSGINVPKPVLVYDETRGKVGIATTPAHGKMALQARMSPDFIAKMMSQGVYVDIFLANWDVIGTGSGNIFIDDEKATRIDPGGSLTYRAMGGRKGQAFGSKVKELESMLKSGTGTGSVYQYSDLKVAAKEFLSVKWSEIENEILNVEKEVSDQLKKKNMKDLLSQWKEDVSHILVILKDRHVEVKDHASNILWND